MTSGSPERQWWHEQIREQWAIKLVSDTTWVPIIWGFLECYQKCEITDKAKFKWILLKYRVKMIIQKSPVVA